MVDISKTNLPRNLPFWQGRGQSSYTICLPLGGISPNVTHFEPQRASVRAGRLVIPCKSGPHASALRLKIYKVSAIWHFTARERDEHVLITLRVMVPSIAARKLEFDAALEALVEDHRCSSS